MKFCKQCGVELPDEANFCKSCGAKVSTSETLSTSEAPEAAKQEEKKQGCLSYIFLYAKVLFIAIGSVFLLVIIMELFSDDKPDSPKTEQHQPKESVFPKSEKLEQSDNVEPVKVEDEENEGYDDGLTPQERIVYWESLIERSEASIEEELAKGDEADMQKVEDIRFDLSVIRRALKEEKEKLTNK